MSILSFKNHVLEIVGFKPLNPPPFHLWIRQCINLLGKYCRDQFENVFTCHHFLFVENFVGSQMCLDVFVKNRVMQYSYTSSYREIIQSTEPVPEISYIRLIRLSYNIQCNSKITNYNEFVINTVCTDGGSVCGGWGMPYIYPIITSTKL